MLENFREKCKKEGWDKGAKLCRNPDKPYSYLVPKLKNKNKMRPLESFCKRMLNFVYNYASMALFLVVLKNLSNANHFKFFKTYDAMEKVEEIIQGIQNLESDHSDLYISTYAGDVKQLFTEVPNNEFCKINRMGNFHAQNK